MSTQLSSTLNEKWTQKIEFYEYGSAANPRMPKIDVVPFAASLHQECQETKILALDLSESLETNYPATSPNLMANFVHINAGDSLTTDTYASSQTFYVIRGKGTSVIDGETLTWKEGDYFALPFTSGIEHRAEEETAFYWTHDQPLLDFLGVKPTKKMVDPVFFSRERLNEELENVRKGNEGKDKNRCGILLANADCPLTKTVTHTQWSLYNLLPAKSRQKAHRHNSIALDYAHTAGPNTYTLIGKELDEDGNIINPIRADWEAGKVFVTPPGWWHSHHNESDIDAIVLPVQDAGLQTYLQTLDIQFARGY